MRRDLVDDLRRDATSGDCCASTSDLMQRAADEIERLRGVAGLLACPCVHTEPCSPRCTCVMPYSSRGCRRCCSYGSKEQRVAVAERLAKLT